MSRRRSPDVVQSQLDGIRVRAQHKLALVWLKVSRLGRVDNYVVNGRIAICKATQYRLQAVHIVYVAVCAFALNEHELCVKVATDGERRIQSSDLGGFGRDRKTALDEQTKY